LRARVKTFYTFLRNIWRARGNFEEQNKESGIFRIIINYCTIHNAQYKYIAQLMHAVIIKIFNIGLLEECYKEENLEITGVAAAACLKRITQ
jgi:hypothetical protein